MKNWILLVLVAPFSLFVAACCSFPHLYSGDTGTRSAKAVIASPNTVEAYLGASLARFIIDPPISRFPSSNVAMAPVGRPDGNDIVHFGAFAVRHGESNNHVTVFWWNAKGELQTYHLAAPLNEKISFMWINERTIRFQLGRDGKIIRLNEDDGPPVSEL